MTAILPFLARYWKLVGIGLLVVAFGIMLSIKNGQIASRDRAIDRSKVEIANLQRDLGQCRSNVSTLQQGIEAQNEANRRALAASDARVAGMQRDLDASRRGERTARTEADAILARRRTGQNQCDDPETLALIRGQ